LFEPSKSWKKLKATEKYLGIIKKKLESSKKQELSKKQLESSKIPRGFIMNSFLLLSFFRFFSNDVLLAQRNLTLNIEDHLIHDSFLLLLASLDMISDLVWIGRVELRPLLDKRRVDHGAVFVHRSQALRKHFHCLVKGALDVRCNRKFRKVKTIS